MPYGSFPYGSGPYGGGSSRTADRRLRIYIDGKELAGIYRPGSLKIDQRLNGRNVCRFVLCTHPERADSAYRPEVGDPIVVRKGLLTLFSGTVDNLGVEDLDFSAQDLLVSCVDHNQTLDRRIVARAFDPSLYRKETTQADFTLGTHVRTTPEGNGGVELESNGAVRLDGTNDHVSIVGHADFNFGAGDFAIEIAGQPWLIAGDFRMLYCNQTLDNCQFIISDTGRIQFYGAGTRIVQSDALTWVLGRWYHFAVTRTGSTVKLYRDGEEVASGTSSASIGDTTAINVGYRNATGSHPFNGRLDELRVWKGVSRTQAQIQAFMAEEIDPTTAGLKCYLKFNEASGTTAQDSTANNHDGTLVNGAAFATLYRTWSNLVADGYRVSPQLGLSTVGDLIESLLTYQATHAQRCLSFDGTDDVVDFGAAQAAQPGNDFTIQLAVKADPTQGSAYTAIATKWGSNLGWKLRGSGATLTFHYGNGTTTKTVSFSGLDIRDNVWRYLTIVKSGTTGVRLFVGGTLNNSDATKTDDVAHFASGQFTVGTAIDDGVGYSEPFKGRIQEVRMWNRALADAEIAANYNTPMEGSEVNLLGYWRFADGDGPVATDDATGPTTITTPGTILGATWQEDGLVNQSTVVIQTSVDGGANWSDATNDQPIPDLEEGEDLRDMTLDVRQVLTSYGQMDTPVVDDVTVDLQGQQTLRDIVLSILEQELAGEGIDASMVEEGPQIDRAVFNYMPVSRVFSELSVLTGMAWTVDYHKVLHFEEAGSSPAPFEFSPTGETIYRSMNRSLDRSQFRNVQYVRGGVDRTAQQTALFAGNSKLQTFTTAYPIADEPTIYLNGVIQTVGVRGVDTGKQWYWKKEDKEISQESEDTAITDSDELQVDYIGFVPILITIRDEQSIAERQAKEGGTGIYENVENDQQIESQDLAFAKATGLLRRYNRILEDVILETDVDGLSAGQEITIEDSSIGTEGEWLIESVSIQDLPAAEEEDLDEDLLRYRIRALKGEITGGDLEFFRRLAEGGRDLVIRENEVVPQINEHTDDVEVSDTPTADDAAFQCALADTGVSGEEVAVADYSEAC